MMNNNLWKLAPDALQGHVFTGFGALYKLLLLTLFALLYRSPEMRLVLALLGGFEAQTVACTAAYLISPWPTPPGSELCSSGMHFPVGLVTLWAGLYVAHWLHRKGSQ